MTANAGQVKYTERAFGQDADLAMRGDIVRGLIELVTNCDDAYGADDGQIRIEWLNPDDHVDTVRVYDRAGGLNADRMRVCFTELGGENSGFNEGKEVRGLFGRGAKDVAAFGSVTFESIRDDAYSSLTLTRDGNWKFDEQDTPASADHRSHLRLSPGESGTLVSIAMTAGGVTTGRDVQRRLAKIASLRPVNARRGVEFVTWNKKGFAQTVPLEYEAPPSTVVIDKTLELPQYPGATVHLVVRRLSTPDIRRPNDESDCGLLVQGRRGVFTNTLFSLNSQALADRYCGELRTDHIEALLLDYEARRAAGEPFAPENQTRILRRDRDGLEPDHLFTKALDALVVTHVMPLMTAELEEAAKERSAGAEMVADLKEASRLIGTQLARDLRELDNDSGAGGDLPGDVGVEAIAVIPPRKTVAPGAITSFTIVHRDELAGALEVSSADDGVATIHTDPSSSNPSDIRPGFSLATVRVQGLVEGSTKLEVKSALHQASADIVVADLPIVEPDPPEGFEFAQSRFTATQHKARSITVLAPATHPGGHVVIEANDPAIVIEPTDAVLDLNAKGWLEARFTVRSDIAPMEADLTARSVGAEATAKLRVVEPHDPASFGLEIEIVPTAHRQRAQVAPADVGIKITIFGGHEVLKRYLGQHLGDSYAGETDPTTRAVLAEIIADALAGYMAEKADERHHERFQDAAAVLAERRKYLNRYLQLAQVITAFS